MVVTSDVGGGGAPPPGYIREWGGSTVLVAAFSTKSLHKVTCLHPLSYVNIYLNNKRFLNWKVLIYYRDFEVILIYSK